MSGKFGLVGGTGPTSGNKRAFLLQFLRNPLEVGSVVPSSQALTESILQSVDAPSISTYVEYGPGTGRFTEHAFEILPQIQKATLLEINPVFQDLLRRRFPNVEICTRADESHQMRPGHVDLVISGLPFTNIDWETTQKTIDEAYELLRPGGSFRTFLYAHTFFLPKNNLLRAYMMGKFEEVRVRFVVRNIPPAFVLEAKK
jgi:phospholipid N-methyltransferase